MREVIVDTGAWTSTDDCYRGLLTALEAPHWHGRNSDALRDSLITGDINGVEPPFRIMLAGDRKLSREVAAWVRYLLEVVAEARAEDRDIELDVAPALGIFN